MPEDCRNPGGQANERMSKGAHFSGKMLGISNIFLQIFQMGVDFLKRYGMITGYEIAGDGVPFWQLHFVP